MPIMESSKGTTNTVELVLVKNDDNVWWPAMAMDDATHLFSFTNDPSEKAEMAKSLMDCATYMSNPENCQIALLQDRELDYKKRVKVISKQNVPSQTKKFFENFSEFTQLNIDNKKWYNASLEALAWLTKDEEDNEASINCRSPGGTLCTVEEKKCPASSEIEVVHFKSASKAQYYGSPGGELYAIEETNLPATKPSTSTSTSTSETEKSHAKRSFKPSDDIRNKRQRRMETAQLTTSNRSPNLSFPCSQTHASSSKSARTHLSSKDYLFPETGEISEVLQSSLSSHVDIISPQTNDERKERSDHLNRKQIEAKKRNKFRPDDPWKTVLNILQQSYGWSIIKGSGLVDWYYVKGENSLPRSKKAQFVQQNLRPIFDYFTSEEQVKDFLYYSHNWRGPKGQEHNPQTPKHITLHKTNIKDIDTTEMSTIKKSELRCSKSKSKDVHKAERLRQVLAQIKKDDEWPTVLSILECGLELVWKSSTMRVKAEHSAKPATEIMKDLEENKDYFLSDEGLKNFANEVYGWTGPVGKEFTPMGGSCRRGRYAHTQSGPLRKKRLVNTTSTKSAAKFEKGQATENDSPNKSTQNHISQDMSDSTESNGTAKPVGTLRERLTECIKCLDSSFAPQNVLFEGLNSSSNFAHGRERIITFLQNCCVLNDENVPTYLSTLYICGRPGTGKVSLSLSIL